MVRSRKTASRLKKKAPTTLVRRRRRGLLMRRRSGGETDMADPRNSVGVFTLRRRNFVLNNSGEKEGGGSLSRSDGLDVGKGNVAGPLSPGKEKETHPRKE